MNKTKGPRHIDANQIVQRGGEGFIKPRRRRRRRRRTERQQR